MSKFPPTSLHTRSRSDGAAVALNANGFSAFNAHHQPTASNSSHLDYLSDDDEDGAWEAAAAQQQPELQGKLCKWTNYIHGWQDRYFALKEGTLVYFRSVTETDFGCRGAVSIGKATVKAHDLDELRFDVSVSDCVWYLRAESVEDRHKWMEALEAYKSAAAAEEALPAALRRHDSAMSLTSNSFSTHSANSKGVNGGARGRGLAEKLAEMETFRDILCRQIDTLQGYFDACSAVAQCMHGGGGGGGAEGPGAAAMYDGGAAAAAAAARVNGICDTHPSINKELLLQHGLHAVDFKGEAITFKATTAGILATLGHCIDVMGQREEHWRRRCEREQIGRRRAEDKYRAAMEGVDAPRSVAMVVPEEQQAKVVVVGGPDYAEGPHSQLGEEEFFDAVENALDKLQEEQELRDKLKKISLEQQSQIEVKSEAKTHALWDTIDKVTVEQLMYARMVPGEPSASGEAAVWELFAEDGEMKMYKREEEIDGMVVDPLKALHQVRGVTARELCHYFFRPEYRLEWETSVEQANVLEGISDDTLVFHQLHTRIWPTAQRDSLFWSHMRKVKTPSSSPDITDTWIVCNKSTAHPDYPENQGNCLRVDLTVCFVCDTVIEHNKDAANATRSDLSCKITYCSIVHPGGWAPASVLRAVYKREYPRFLKRFTQYVTDKSKDKPIMW